MSILGNYFSEVTLFSVQTSALRNNEMTQFPVLLLLYGVHTVCERHIDD